jgi:arginyl-tRNA synthetase
MRFADGIFSSRKGNVIKLTDLLDEAVKRAYEIVELKNPNLSQEEKRNIAEIVGIGAVKYADLSQNRQSAIIFEWDKILSFEGNTSPYLQYVYARVQSLLKKAKEQGISEYGDKLILKESAERNLALALLQFPSTVLSAANSCKPNLVADYIFETAKKFNTFYNAIPILKEEDSEVLKSRLLLSERTGKIMRDGLELLGIKTVDRM